MNKFYIEVGDRVKRKDWSCDSEVSKIEPNLNTFWLRTSDGKDEFSYQLVGDDWIVYRKREKIVWERVDETT